MCAGDGRGELACAAGSDEGVEGDGQVWLSSAREGGDWEPAVRSGVCGDSRLRCVC